MIPTFKPKKQQIHVPGFGVVQKEDFNAEHTKALLKRAKKHGIDESDFIKQHLVVDSYGDQPLFQEPEGEQEEETKGKGKKGKEKAGE